MICHPAACIPWNFPLHFKPREDGSVRLMNFQENIAYALHVLHHQSPDSWQGEIEEYTKELRAASRAARPSWLDSSTLYA